jgi:AraC family transcriptional regulator
MPQLAHVAGRHEIHIAREFRRFFGVSVGEFARRLRIDQAARLLVRSNASISDIALESGFSSHSHLCREFKARFGVTPSVYRMPRRSPGDDPRLTHYPPLRDE